MDDAGSIYRELHHLAKVHRRKWSGNATLNTTALIHEAWLKMNPARSNYQDKTHFFATAARVMRQVLINYAERSTAQKRLSPEVTAGQNLFDEATEFTLEDLLFMNEMLDRLEKHNERGCRLLECRIFGGMTVEETARALSISVSTVKREWILLSTWLYHELKEQNRDDCESLKRA